MSIFLQYYGTVSTDVPGREFWCIDYPLTHCFPLVVTCFIVLWNWAWQQISPQMGSQNEIIRVQYCQLMDYNVKKI